MLLQQKYEKKQTTNQLIGKQKETENLQRSKYSVNKSSTYVVGINWIYKCTLQICLLQLTYFKFLLHYEEQNASVLMLKRHMLLCFHIFLCKKSHSKFTVGLKDDLTLISGVIFDSAAGSCPNQTYLTWQITQ